MRSAVESLKVRGQNPIDDEANHQEQLVGTEETGSVRSRNANAPLEQDTAAGR